MTAIYTIERRRRKSLAIKIVQGEVRILAPHGLSQRDIDRALDAKAAWIAGHLAKQQQTLAAVTPRRWAHGECCWWLGESVTLNVQADDKSFCYLDGDQLMVRLSSRVQHRAEKTRSLVTNWYQQQAKRWLDAFSLEHFEALPEDLLPRRLEVKNFTGKWGCCTAKRMVQLTWRLWLAPEFVVRYVVLHELAHLRHFNHSKAFWQLVERLEPDYKLAEAWLKQHSMTVLNDDYLGIATV